jgi:peptidyl-prolyl cis-trans isomerase C
MVERLLQQALASVSEVTAEDEELFFQQHPELFQQPERVILRQILLEDRDVATSLQGELARDPKRFEEVARQKSRSADRGLARSHAMGELPREVVVALHELEPGDVSRVVEMPPAFLLFLLEDRRPEHVLSLEEARPGIRARLRESREAEARRRLLAELRLKMGVRLFAENLPFEYVQEEPA